MTVLYTSDLHLGHKNILKQRTQFHDIDEHDKFLIQKWNNKVKDDDEVYILGDFSYRAKLHAVLEYLSCMNGKKHLIVGNHDNEWLKKMDDNDVKKYFQSVNQIKTMEISSAGIDKIRITLCHFPMLEWSGSRYVDEERIFLIHGHIHGSRDTSVFEYIKRYQPHALNAGVDVNNFEPVTFEELRENNRKWYSQKNIKNLSIHLL